jgi:hypothetical protein
VPAADGKNTVMAGLGPMTAAECRRRQERLEKGWGMIRFLFRFVGLWILAGGFVALVLDGVRSIASSEIVTTPLGVTWLATSSDSLTRFQSFVETNLSPAIWETAAVPVLNAPLFVVLGVLGLLLMLIGHKKGE